MSGKRGQGRPPREENGKGLDKLLEGAREAIRSGPETNVSRQEIARRAGVTPALVTYYFPDQDELIRSATWPTVQEAIARLEDVLGSDGSYEIRLKGLIALFIDFTARNSRILDAFIETTGRSKDPESGRQIMTALKSLTLFFEEAGRDGVWRGFDPTFFLFAVWGMCKFVAEPPALPVQMFAHLDHAKLRDAQAGLIADLLVNGIRKADPA